MNGAVRHNVFPLTDSCQSKIFFSTNRSVYIITRLRVVPHFSSGIVERARVKITPRLFSGGVIFTRARVSHAPLSLRKNGGLLVVYIITCSCNKFHQWLKHWMQLRRTLGLSHSFIGCTYFAFKHWIEQYHSFICPIAVQKFKGLNSLVLVSTVFLSHSSDK